MRIYEKNFVKVLLFDKNSDIIETEMTIRGKAYGGNHTILDTDGKRFYAEQLC